jgi:hypothetical protein
MVLPYEWNVYYYIIGLTLYTNILPKLRLIKICDNQ